MNEKKRLDEVKPHKVLRGFRLRDELSRADLANRLGIAADRVAAWEENREKIPDEYALKLAEVFQSFPEVFETVLNNYKKIQATLKDGYASCAIEGYRFSKEEKKEIENQHLSGMSSDEMIVQLKKKMGLK